MRGRHVGARLPGLLRLLGEGGCWVKLSGAHRVSRAAPDYPDARAFHEALVAANPEQLVWGSDWPHPRMEGEMPNAGHLLDLFNEWTPDDAIRRRILVDNPARLYDFPEAELRSRTARRVDRDHETPVAIVDRWVPALALLQLRWAGMTPSATAGRYIPRRSGS